MQLGAAILVGDLAPRLARGRGEPHPRLRAAVDAAALAAVVAVLAAFYCDAHATIGALRATSYPGQRVEAGGAASFARVFAGSYDFFLSETSFPTAWENVCEASGFVLLFPAALAALLVRALRRERVAAIELCLLAYVAATLAWLLFAWPPGLARASGFAFAIGTRSLLGLGLASVIWCCVFLAGDGTRELPHGTADRRGGARRALARLRTDGVSDYLKAAGAKVWNGTLMVPPLAELALLDPEGRQRSVYDRFAHVALVPRSGSEISIDQAGLPRDQYWIAADPVHEVWRRLGVRYLVLPAAEGSAGLAGRAEFVAALAHPGPDLPAALIRPVQAGSAAPASTMRRLLPPRPRCQMYASTMK